ncbi:MAG: STN domain-containing protein, partial [Tannerellaceae bacterium]
MVFRKKLDLERSSKTSDLSFFGKTKARQRLIALCILASTPLSTYASVADGDIRLSIQVKNTSLQQVLDLIEDRSEYKFFFNNNQVDTQQLVSVNTEGSDVFEILKRVLKDTDLEYSVMDKN